MRCPHPLGSLLAATLLLAARLAAQVHPEITVARDAQDHLVASFDHAKPYPLGPSWLIGIDGYATAMPGLASLFVARPADGLFPLDATSDIEFVLLGADAGLAVWNDHGTDTMHVGESFSLGHPPFDSHPVWNCVQGESGHALALRLQFRDRTGRYQPSEILAPAFVPDESQALYVCPMNCAGGTTHTEPGTCPICGMRLKRLSGRSYSVSVAPDGDASARIAPGTAVTLRFHLAAPDGSAVNDLQLVHEKLIHLILVSDDLSWFSHEHPERQDDGSFLLRTQFPHGGGFTLFHDFTPASAGMQVVPVELHVDGDSGAPTPLVPDSHGAREVDGCTITLQAPSPIRSLVNLALTAHVARDGQPVTDLQPYLGTLGHLIMISADRKRFVHSHPVGAPPVAGAPAGPDVKFSVLFPSPGRYKAWVQVQREGRMLTAPFVFDVIAP